MNRHRTPPLPRRDVPRRFVALATGAVFGIVCPPLVLAAQASAPKVAASSVVMPTAEETVPRPHMGPLEIPSIGVVAPSVDALVSSDRVDGSRTARNTVRIATESPWSPPQNETESVSPIAPGPTEAVGSAVPASQAPASETAGATDTTEAAATTPTQTPVETLPTALPVDATESLAESTSAEPTP